MLRRFASFQAGLTDLKSPGVSASPYQPTPKPSPFVVVPLRAWRLCSMSDLSGLSSSSSRWIDSPEYASHRHI